MQISTAHSGLNAFVSPANPGKTERGKKTKGKNTYSGERESRVGIPLGGLERILSFK